MFKIVQQSKDNTCVAAVLAMITNNTEQYVLDWFEHQDAPFCDDDAIIFLAHHGIFFAVCGTIIDDNKQGKDLSKFSTLEITYDLNKCTAYLIVESYTRKELSHAVLLKEGLIYDPLCNKPQKLNKYKVLYFYPLLITENREKIAQLSS